MDYLDTTNWIDLSRRKYYKSFVMLSQGSIQLKDLRWFSKVGPFLIHNKDSMCSCIDPWETIFCCFLNYHMVYSRGYQFLSANILPALWLSIRDVHSSSFQQKTHREQPTNASNNAAIRYHLNLIFMGAQHNCLKAEPQEPLLKQIRFNNQHRFPTLKLPIIKYLCMKANMPPEKAENLQDW